MKADKKSRGNLEDYSGIIVGIFLILFTVIVKYKKNSAAIIPSGSVNHNNHVIVGVLIFLFVLASVYFLYRKVRARKINERELELDMQAKLEGFDVDCRKQTAIRQKSLVDIVFNEDLDWEIRTSAFVDMVDYAVYAIENHEYGDALPKVDVYIKARNLIMKEFENKRIASKILIKALDRSIGLIISLKHRQAGFLADD